MIAASVVIPNWNGRDLLERYLPSVVEALAGNPENEVIVVDNGSTDGSADFVRERFPSVRVLALDRNLGFGGGSNAGFRAAKNDIVVLLNSDMRVRAGFSGAAARRFHRRESVRGVVPDLLQRSGQAARRNRAHASVVGERRAARASSRRSRPSPVRIRAFTAAAVPARSIGESFWSWADSTSCSRRFIWKTPISDTWRGSAAGRCSISRAAWCITSIAGTIGKTLYASANRSGSQEELHPVLLEEHSRVAAPVVALLLHFGRRGVERVFRRFAGARQSAGRVAGVSPVARSASGAHSMHAHSPPSDDTEAFRRPLGGYFRDRFLTECPPPEKLSVLVRFAVSNLSSYPWRRRLHVSNRARADAALCSLHLVILLDHDWEQWDHAELEEAAASAEYLVRMEGHAQGIRIHPAICRARVCEFRSRMAAASPDLYARGGRGAARIYVARPILISISAGSLACCSNTTSTFNPSGAAWRAPRSLTRKAKATFEYLRALRYELNILPRFDRVQVCSPENGNYLLVFLARLGRQAGRQSRGDRNLALRIPAGRPRAPDACCFLGSFRHLPNQEALDWFTQKVLPRCCSSSPEARLMIVGADPPPRHSYLI